MLGDIIKFIQEDNRLKQFFWLFFSEVVYFATLGFMFFIILTLGLVFLDNYNFSKLYDFVLFFKTLRLEFILSHVFVLILIAYFLVAKENYLKYDNGKFIYITKLILIILLYLFLYNLFLALETNYIFVIIFNLILLECINRFFKVSSPNLDFLYSFFAYIGFISFMLYKNDFKEMNFIFIIFILIIVYYRFMRMLFKELNKMHNKLQRNATNLSFIINYYNIKYNFIVSKYENNYNTIFDSFHKDYIEIDYFSDPQIKYYYLKKIEYRIMIIKENSDNILKLYNDNNIEIQNNQFKIQEMQNYLNKFKFSLDLFK